MRLDLWLDISCVFRTRTEAQRACKNGKIDVNGQPAKPHRDVKVGDEIVVQRPQGRRQRLVIRALADKHVAKAEARELYTDLTPPPTAEEIEARKIAKLTGPFLRPRSAGAPDKRERREIRRFKERN
jgi:ribosome-associated heat shock protein Hsp15